MNTTEDIGVTKLVPSELINLHNILFKLVLLEKISEDEVYVILANAGLIKTNTENIWKDSDNAIYTLRKP